MVVSNVFNWKAGCSFNSHIFLMTHITAAERQRWYCAQKDADHVMRQQYLEKWRMDRLRGGIQELRAEATVKEIESGSAEMWAETTDTKCQQMSKSSQFTWL